MAITPLAAGAPPVRLVLQDLTVMVLGYQLLGMGRHQSLEVGPVAQLALSAEVVLHSSHFAQQARLLQELVALTACLGRIAVEDRSLVAVLLDISAPGETQHPTLGEHRVLLAAIALTVPGSRCSAQPERWVRRAAP